MDHPKYVLVFEMVGAYPFAIYEQAEVSLEGRKQIGQRLYTRYDNINLALSEMYALNGRQPVILAISSKQIDNVHDLSRD